MMKFRSAFAERLTSFVKLRRGLGFSFNSQSYVLFAFDRYLVERGYRGPLTQDLASDFASSRQDISKNECARRYQVVRHFSEYLSAFDPDTPRLDPHYLRRDQHRPPAHIYSEEEIAALLREAIRISRRNPLRGVTLHAMVGLAATTGLRIGEVVRLDKTDVDLKTGVMLVRRTKFGKDRMVPLHPSTLEVLRNYASTRDAAFPGLDCPAFFINMARRRYVVNTLQLLFWELTRRIGIRGPKGHGPSFHDLRHSFAVRRVVTWYREGVDPQIKLPALATYMGHVDYTNTAYYLTATSELLELAAEVRQRRDERRGEQG